MSTSSLFGTNAAVVIDLMKARRADPTAFPDRKLGLIVEGGGMRGVLSAGALLAIDLMGYRPVFDQVYATSAGSVNAAFFLSGQGKVGITVYFNHINNRNFINPTRFSKIVDVDFVYDHIITEIVILDEKKLRSARAEFYLSLTEVSKGKNVLINVRDSDESVAKLLKASSAIPVLYNKSVSIDGKEYVDGGVTCTLPIHQARDSGCTDILVLLTKPGTHPSKSPKFFERIMFYAMTGRKYPALMKAFVTSLPMKKRDRLTATGLINLDGINIATICPPNSGITVKRTTLRRELLAQAARTMALKTAVVFNEDSTIINSAFEKIRA